MTTDWPADAQGFTIQLSLVPKDGATQDDRRRRPRQTATSNGAADVGALDSDLYPSLDPGNYVIYSGVFTQRQPAVQALGKLGDGFPDAVVIEVGSGAKGGESGGAPGSERGYGEAAPDALWRRRRRDCGRRAMAKRAPIELGSVRSSPCRAEAAPAAAHPRPGGHHRRRRRRPLPRRPQSPRS